LNPFLNRSCRRGSRTARRIKFYGSILDSWISVLILRDRSYGTNNAKEGSKEWDDDGSGSSSTQLKHCDEHDHPEDSNSRDHMPLVLLFRRNWNPEEEQQEQEAGNGIAAGDDDEAGESENNFVYREELKGNCRN
jgi:hypothetical protein